MAAPTFPSRRRLAIGYWHDDEEGTIHLPHPQPLVDPTWEQSRHADIVTYLKRGHPYRLARGLSYCRLGCKGIRLQRTPVEGVEARVDEFGWYQTETEMSNGSAEMCDDVWCWPEGLAHYVEVHQIRLPDDFVAHAASHRFEPPPCGKDKFEHDYSFWLNWTSRHASFRFEPGCLACCRSKTDPRAHASARFSLASSK